jgi:hypothetical protein
VTPEAPPARTILASPNSHLQVHSGKALIQAIQATGSTDADKGEFFARNQSMSTVGR